VDAGDAVTLGTTVVVLILFLAVSRQYWHAAIRMGQAKPKMGTRLFLIAGVFVFAGAVERTARVMFNPDTGLLTQAVTSWFVMSCLLWVAWRSRRLTGDPPRT
jgi:hypothetical protein